MITNKFNLPEPIYRSLTHSDYSRGDSNRSVTQLIDSPRIRILRQEHDPDEDVVDLTWRVLGSAVHLWFEQHTRADSEYTPEERLFMEVEGWSISGAIDIQHGPDDAVILTDYKCTGVYSVIFGKLEWERQLNLYALLVEKVKGLRVEKLQIAAILRDWSLRKSLKEGASYPQAPMVMVDVPLWSLEQREKYLQDRVSLHQDVEFARLTGMPLIECTDEERWVKDASYAVKKPRNKRAMRVFSTFEEAEKYRHSKDPDGSIKLEIEHRPGEATRCVFNYCGVAEFCDQWQREQEDHHD